MLMASHFEDGFFYLRSLLDFYIFAYKFLRKIVARHVLSFIYTKQ